MEKGENQTHVWHSNWSHSILLNPSDSPRFPTASHRFTCLTCDDSLSVAQTFNLAVKCRGQSNERTNKITQSVPLQTWLFYTQPNHFYTFMHTFINVHDKESCTWKREQLKSSFWYQHHKDTHARTHTNSPVIHSSIRNAPFFHFFQPITQTLANLHTRTSTYKSDFLFKNPHRVSLSTL